MLAARGERLFIDSFDVLGWYAGVTEFCGVESVVSK